MVETRYGKYIITEYHKPKQGFAPGATYQPGDRTPLLYLDTDVIEGAFYLEAHWFWPAMTKNKSEERVTKPHTHDYDEVLALIGTDPDAPEDLCGESDLFYEFNARTMQMVRSSGSFFTFFSVSTAPNRFPGRH